MPVFLLAVLSNQSPLHGPNLAWCRLSLSRQYSLIPDKYSTSTHRPILYSHYLFYSVLHSGNKPESFEMAT